MRQFKLLLIFSCLLTSLPSPAVSGRMTATTSQRSPGVTSLKIPEQYNYFLEREHEEAQIIPESAKDAQDSGQFFSKVLDFHVQRYLKKNPDSSLNKLKKVEDAVNDSTSIDSEDFKLKSKLNLASGSAEVNVQYLLDYRLWFEDQFSRVNAAVDFYQSNSSRFGLDFSSDRQDTRTQLGFRIIW